MQSCRWCIPSGAHGAAMGPCPRAPLINAIHAKVYTYIGMMLPRPPPAPTRLATSQITSRYQVSYSLWHYVLLAATMVFYGNGSRLNFQTKDNSLRVSRRPAGPSISWAVHQLRWSADCSSCGHDASARLSACLSNKAEEMSDD